MTRATLTSLFCGLSLLVLGGAYAQAAGQAKGLAAHRAFYTLEAARLDDSAGITQISGKLAYEITGSECEGYSVSYRAANRYVQAEGQAQVSDVQLTSYESGDGLEFDLRQKQFNNSKLEKESNIKVKRPKPGAAAAGEITGDKPVAFTVEANTVFPTYFQKELLGAAAQGANRYDTVIFEGSEGEKSLRVISFIGPKKQASSLVDTTASKALGSFAEAAYWPVTVSYYALDARDDEPPAYQATFNMLENGISTDLLMDYGTYALKGTLNKLEVLKQESCN